MQTFNKIDRVSGTLGLPGDKSISHRSVMFSALAKGKSRIINLSNGEDVKSTRKCFEALGVNIDTEGETVIVDGKGFKGLRCPSRPLNAGNSGTTTRLISGILAAQDFETEIIGDESLSKRPMNRIIKPLTSMGARIEGTINNTLPLKIYPSDRLHSIKYEMMVASAQVKSAVLLAGLHLEDETEVIEMVPTRDHTERMLGLKTETVGETKIISVSRNDYPETKDYLIPSDVSTASFFIVLALLVKNSNLRINNISLNETRTGFIQLLEEMGADIQKENLRTVAGEHLGDVIVKSSQLKNIEIKEKIIPNIIDEIPILAVAGILAEGGFSIRHAEELRGKESDRIDAICKNLKNLGLDVEEYKDGFAFDGNVKNDAPLFESFSDHRIAMSFGILSLLSKNGGRVNNFGCVGISNPDFLNQIKAVVS